MGDVHYIVEKLQGPPFNMDVTLLSFSEKSPQELLKLLSDVTLKISPKLQRINPNEPPEQTADRVAVFLRNVKYIPSLDVVTFRQLLAAADKDTVHSVLKWVLSQGQMLEKRAFVGSYLSLPDMPEELNYDPEVIELKEIIKGLQADFIEAHKALDTARDEEKERLAEKVEKAAAQAAALPDASSYRNVCVALRQEHDREVLISQQLQAQQQQLERAEGSFQRSAGRLREMQQHLASHGGSDATGGSQVLEVLQDDVARLRLQVSTRWPKELEAKQRRLAAVQDTLSNGINSEGDLLQLLSQEATMKQQVTAMQERQVAVERARAADKAFLQVRQAQQMATLVARKKAELTAKVERLQERRDTLATALDSSSSHGGTAGGGSECGGISDEDWRVKYEAIKAKLPSYKAMKKELAELEAEAFVLNRTLDILQQQEQSLRGQVQQLEAQAGVQGYADLAAGLEKVSEEKGAVDEAKGNVLQEVSATVEQITAAVKRKKLQLAPAIQELRSLREQYSSLEALHAEKKAAFESAVGNLGREVTGLESDVARLQKEVADSSAELLKVKSSVIDLEGHIQRIAATGGEELRRRCQLQLAESETLLRHLREQQRRVKDQHTHGLAQISMMRDLLQLLQVKRQVLDGQLAAGLGGSSISSSTSKAAGRGGLLAAGAGGVRLAGLPAQSFNTNVMVL
eukprot:gene12912-13039_t